MCSQNADSLRLVFKFRVAGLRLRRPTVASALSDIIWTNSKGHGQLKHITLHLSACSDTLYGALTYCQAGCVCVLVCACMYCTQINVTKSGSGLAAGVEAICVCV